MLDHALRARRVLYPCHNYKHAPVIRTVRKALDEDAIGKVHLVTLQTFRNTHARGVKEWRADWRRERRWSGGGIAMDHGSHTFYLAFDWLGAYPTSITAKMSQMAMPGTAPGAVVDADTEDNFSCAMTFPGGATASAHLTWTAGIRRVLYTLHGSKGAIRVEDDDVEVARMRTSGGETAWDVEKQKVASEWMNTGHGAWFASMLDRFAKTLDEGDFAGREAQASLRCVELIATAYASARAGSRELPLPSGAPASGERHLPDYQTAP
jgi:predicted dehydrogenase